jgi:hypothetical protein
MSHKDISVIFAIGATTDNKVLVAGVWKFYETYGLPLDVILSLCIEKNWMPCWMTLYRDMLSAGMQHQRILSKLEEAISDSFGKAFCDVVISRLNNIFTPQEITP